MRGLLLSLLLTIFAIVLSSALPAPVSIPNVRIFKHDQKAIDKFITEKKEALYNHDFSGLSCLESGSIIPKSFRLMNESIVIGHGPGDFERASKLMFSFDMVNAMRWANVVELSGTTKSDKAVGTVLCTLIKCFNSVWTLNPVRVCHISRSSKTQSRVKQVDQIAYSTITGHLISGEERFRVTLENNNDVVFEIFSFTKGAGILGTLSMPLIRPIQSTFFRDVTLTMKNLMKSP
jgi:uncharacterized protein (UPF0548 family)